MSIHLSVHLGLQGRINHSGPHIPTQSGGPSSPFLCSLLPSHLLPFLLSPPFLSTPLLSPPLPWEVGPLSTGSGERCKLPQLGLGQTPSQNRFWCILAFKSDIWWQHFNDSPENQLPKFHPLPSWLGLGSVVTLSYELWATNSLYSLQPAVMLKILILAFVDHVGQQWHSMSKQKGHIPVSSYSSNFTHRATNSSKWIGMRLYLNQTLRV